MADVPAIKVLQLRRLPRTFLVGGQRSGKRGAAAVPAGSGSAGHGRRGRSWWMASAPAIEELQRCRPDPALRSRPPRMFLVCDWALPAIEELLLRRPDPDLQVVAVAAVPGAWPGAAGDR
ncbi:hypothetical protein RB620_24685 [Paenibacillus sp. LHD-117]|uniref:hypothetical protein n=1 Tax=Paenibacillus sp. LHD-117 TaxID=3071412 RepID=UPI0027DFC8F9|nr:hypothetical protein [Paenibacillus sp. LHD-117]MDQ6422634.1 hypothetical protein [Paenibacillus sp. LHD-117]